MRQVNAVEERGVIFDVDGVLIDSYRPHQRSWMDVAREHGLVMTAEQFAATFGRTSREIMAFFRELNEKEGLTVILVTHDLEIARRARRALVLIDGEVVVDTTDFDRAAEVLHRRALTDDPA